jgi:hypothetical protein
MTKQAGSGSGRPGSAVPDGQLGCRAISDHEVQRLVALVVYTAHWLARISIPSLIVYHDWWRWGWRRR